MDGESHDSGMLVTFDCLQRMSDGKPGKVRCQEIWRGTIEEFRASHRGVAIIGYSRMEDGQVEAPVMLNERLEVAVGRRPQAQPADGHRPQAQPTDGQRPEAGPQAHEVRILRDGDSYIKVCGDKVYRLQWTEYDDQSSEFDRRIKVEDGRIMVTEWRELSE